MSMLRCLAFRTFQFLGRSCINPTRFITTASRASSTPPTGSPRLSPTTPPTQGPIEEEGNPNYNVKNFYPARPGDLFHSRYKILAKLGWGISSTVWLAQDTKRWWWQPSRYVTLKIAVTSFVDENAAEHEVNMTRRLLANPAHEGFAFVRTAPDHFRLTGPDGTHVCLVFEPMREPFWLFQRRWDDNKIPPEILKIYLRFILQGLDYMYSECRIIHTDLKADNIMMTFEEPSVLESYVDELPRNPVPPKDQNRPLVSRSRNGFGTLRSLRSVPKIVDFGLARQGDGPDTLTRPIQAPLYHAPEVLLGTGWSYDADIWNLGVLIWELMEDEALFKHTQAQGAHSGRAHVAEMVALLGPPPAQLLQREQRWSQSRWDRPAVNSEGKSCFTAREYFGGPFFDSRGEFLFKHLVPSAVRLRDTVPSLGGEDKELFLNFASKMLQWLPEKRQTAKELLDDPWLKSYPGAPSA